MRHVPNALSIARILLAPVILYLIARGQYTAALLWFAPAAATDALDGHLARSLNATSRLGAYLDPIGDKLLLSGCFAVLGWNGVIPLWLVLIVLGRDVAILLFAAGALLFTQNRRDFPPSLWGKLSTMCQIGYVLAVIATQAGAGAFQILIPALQWATVLLLAISAADYARQAIQPGHNTVRLP